MTASTSLGSLLAAVRRRWLLFVVVAVPIVAGTFIYATQLPDEYEGESVVAFAPKTDDARGSDTLRIVIARYAVIATSPATLDGLAPAFAGYDRDELEDALDVTVPAESANVRIVVTLEDAADAAAIANAVASAVVDNATSDDKLYEGTVVRAAQVATRASGPPRLLIEFAGVLGAVFAGLLAIGIARAVRPTIETLADLEASGAPADAFVGRDDTGDAGAATLLRLHLVRMATSAAPVATVSAVTGDELLTRRLTGALRDAFERMGNDVDVIDDPDTMIQPENSLMRLVPTPNLLSPDVHPLALTADHLVLIVERGCRGGDLQRVLAVARSAQIADVAIVASGFSS